MKSYQTAQRGDDDRATEATFYDFGQFTLDPHLRTLRSGDRLIPIQPICFDLLFALVRSGHRTMSKDDLIASAWPSADASDANLAQRISTLREVLGDRAERNHYIVTIPKHGYRFVARTTQRSPGAAWCSAPGVYHRERRRVTRTGNDWYERRAAEAPHNDAEDNFLLSPLKREIMEALWTHGGWSTIAEVVAERKRSGKFALGQAAIETAFERLCGRHHLEKRSEAVDVFRPTRTRDDFDARALEGAVDELFAINRTALLRRIIQRLAEDDDALAAFTAQLAASTPYGWPIPPPAP